MKTKRTQDFLDTQEFNDLMSMYRVVTTTDQETVIRRFEAVKDFIREKSVAPKMLQALISIRSQLIDGGAAEDSTTISSIDVVIKEATS